MDIHRCRFVPFPSSPINALAFNRPYLPTSEKSRKSVPVRLAIGRENGDIEVWNPLDGAWHQEVTLHGGIGRKIDALVWATEPDVQLPDGKVNFGRSRLFSIGGAASITEWDLARRKPRKHASGQHGDIWCLGIQPASSSPGSTRLVAGTGDGCLVLYSIEEDDLRLQRILVKSPSKKVHFVSIAFQSRHIAAVGCSDASIRVFDLRNGSLVRRMTLGRDLAAGVKDVIVWCVKSLPNGDIVSGDSTGQVCIWDGKTFTQAQRIQSHTQDVLSLAVNGDGSAIISGGMDKRTVFYWRTSASQNARWAKAFHRRYHTHDVKAMASFEGRGMSVVVSGGSDASPVVMPLKEAGLENHRTLPHLPQSIPLLSAPEPRLLLSWWGRQIHIWQLPKHLPLSADADTESRLDGSARPPKVLKKILLKGTSDIASASISRDGSVLAVATVAEFKMFYLELKTTSIDGEELAVSKPVVPELVAEHGAALVQVSPDGKWICLVREDSEVMLLRVERDPSSGRPVVSPGSRTLQRMRRLKREALSCAIGSGLGSYARTITQAVFAPDSRMLAVADLSGYVDTWILQTESKKDGEGTDVSPGSPDPSYDSSDASFVSEEPDGLRGGMWVRNPRASLIPKLPAAATVLSFSEATPSGGGANHGGALVSDYELLAVTATSRLFVFNPLGGLLTQWSRRHPPNRLPEVFRANRDLIKGAVWHSSRVWLFGVSSLFMLDLSRDLVGRQDRENGNDDTRDPERGIKRKRGGPRSGAGDRIDTERLHPRHVKQAVIDPESGHDKWADVDMEDTGETRHDGVLQDEDEDDGGDETDGGDLRVMREGHSSTGEDGSNSNAGRTSWWHTYKYRPILGAVPLEPSEPSDLCFTSGSGMDETLSQLEVVLVERPLWDTPLPPRYMVDDEREARSHG